MTLLKRLQKNKVRPDQAGPVRRFLAMGFDFTFIGIVALIGLAMISEVEALMGEKTGIVSQLIHALKQNRSVVLVEESDMEKEIKMAYRASLREKLSAEEYQKARSMSVREMEEAYPEVLTEIKKNTKVIKVSERYKYIREFIIGYLYFVLFFRFGGQTWGKKIFRLKVVDLKGKEGLGWYQAFERAHGYAASALFLSLGFWQIFWDREGLAMHDRIAETTVIKLPKKKSLKKKKKKPKDTPSREEKSKEKPIRENSKDSD